MLWEKAFLCSAPRGLTYFKMVIIEMRDLDAKCTHEGFIKGVLSNIGPRWKDLPASNLKFHFFAYPEVRHNFSGNSRLRAIKQQVVAEITACLCQCFSLDFPWG